MIVDLDLMAEGIYGDQYPWNKDVRKLSLGGSTTTTFRYRAWNPGELLELVRSELCGNIDPISLDGAENLAALTDDHKDCVYVSL
mmetsp:Transcript_14761/g.30031  ORF Transcript_14761/g.30031 Transcript_14761/m.30031 type:complete len:85 (+) Transcript_14761:3420-3674(+)